MTAEVATVGDARAQVYELLAKGRAKAAVKVANQALALAKDGSKEDEAVALTMMANAKLADKNVEEVPEALKSAVKIYRGLDDKVSLAAALQSLGQVEVARGAKGKPKDALKYAEESRKLFLAAGKVGDALESWDTTVTVYAAKGDFKGAVKVGKDAMLASKRESDADGIRLGEQMVIKAYLKGGDDEGALQMAKKACARMVQAGDWKGQADMLKLAAELSLKNERIEMALQAATEALTLLKTNRGKSNEETEEAQLRTIVAEAFVARGETPPMTASRAKALKALDDMGKAAEDRQAGAFHDAVESMYKAGGFTKKDQAAVFDAVVAKDPSAIVFIQDNMPTAEGPAALAPPVDVVCLREFPAIPKGEIDGVAWNQTMGKVVLTHVLDGETFTEADVKVEISSFQVQVSISGKKLPALTGELCNNILPSRSWWILRVDPVKKRSKGVETSGKRCTVVISLAKRDHKQWAKLWYQGQMKHPTAKGRYAWTQAMQDEIEADAREMGGLQPLAPGQPEMTQGKFYFSADDMCVGIGATQDDSSVTITVCFDGEAMKAVQQKISFEDLFAADVYEDKVNIFLNGDEMAPILYGELWGRVVPKLATWKMIEAAENKWRSRQQNMAGAGPALEIKMPKHGNSRGKWSKIFNASWNHRMMHKNFAELEDMLLVLQADAEADAEGGGEKLSEGDKAGLYEKVLAWKPDRFPGLPGAELLPGQDGMDLLGTIKDTVDEITKRTGVAGRARWNDELGRYSYIY